MKIDAWTNAPCDAEGCVDGWVGNEPCKRCVNGRMLIGQDEPIPWPRVFAWFLLIVAFGVLLYVVATWRPHK